jgi:hypothetical protein
MISKKVLYIKELAFNLPDDFNGNIEDALEILIAERRASTNIKKETTNEIINDSEAINWLWNHQDKKCRMSYCICEYNEKNQQWEYR